MKPVDVKIDYDPLKVEHLGKPKYFDPDHYLDSVEQMVAADEIVLALQMIDNMPGYYRMNPYPRAVELKKKIHQFTLGLYGYILDEYETYENSLRHQKKLNPQADWDNFGLAAMIDIPFCFPRGPLTIEAVKKLNDEGKIPHIYEMGPANYYLPYGLHSKGLKFTYFADSLNKVAFADHSERLKKLNVWKEKPDDGQFQIFVCFETIEHLWNIDDIHFQYHRYNCNADMIFVSTPCGTLLGGLPNLDRELGHIRTFTPKELFLIVNRWWPDYDWSDCLNHMMVIFGKRKVKNEI